MTIGATNLQTELNLTNADALFKIKYEKYYDNTFNTSTPFWNRVAKPKTFTGKRVEFPAPLGYSGGVGSGSIPEANTATYGDVQITAKKMYAVGRVDREAMGASEDMEGAFVKASAEVVKKTTESDIWNHSRAAFNSLVNGSVGTIDTAGVTDNGSGNYSLVISSATWKEANFEENMFVNIETGNTDLFEITTVTPSTRTIVVQRQAGGTQVPVDADVIYMQGSEGNDIESVHRILIATSSTYYNIAIGRRWQAYQVLSYGAGISPQLINRLIYGTEKQCGKSPDTWVTSYKQMEKLVNQMEDQKRYVMPVTREVQGLKGTVSFKGVQIITSSGVAEVFPDKFCNDDTIMGLNTNYLKYYQRPNSGWVKEDVKGDGYGWLRVIGEDQFEARHAVYGQLFIAPPFHCIATGLTTTP